MLYLSNEGGRSNAAYFMFEVGSLSHRVRLAEELEMRQGFSSHLQPKQGDNDHVST